MSIGSALNSFINLAPGPATPGTPPSYEAQVMAIKRQQAMADALRASADKDIPIQSSNGIQAPIPWTAVLGQALQGLAANVQDARAQKAQQQLSAQDEQETRDLAKLMMQKRYGTPGIAPINTTIDATPPTLPGAPAMPPKPMPAPGAPAPIATPVGAPQVAPGAPQAGPGPQAGPVGPQAAPGAPPAAAPPPPANMAAVPLQVGGEAAQGNQPMSLEDQLMTLLQTRQGGPQLEAMKAALRAQIMAKQTAQYNSELDWQNKLRENTQLPMSMADRQRIAAELKAKEDAATFTNQLPQTADERAKDAIKRAELAETAKYHKQLTGTGGGPVDASIGAQVATGMPINQIVPGYGRQASAGRAIARQAGINQIMSENPGMTPAQAGVELAQRTVNFGSGKKSDAQLAEMQGATRAAVDQLHFNIGKVNQILATMPSTDLSPLINGIIRGEQYWTGDPRYSQLYLFMSAAAKESARIMSGGQASKAQLVQGAAEEAKKWADVGMTPASWASVASGMLEEGTNRIENYTNARKAGALPGAFQSPGATKPPPASGGSTNIKVDINGNRL